MMRRSTRRRSPASARISVPEPPDGQQALRQAFTHYYRAFFESDPKTRAELTLLANIEIGFHERRACSPKCPKPSTPLSSTGSSSGASDQGPFSVEWLVRARAAFPGAAARPAEPARRPDRCAAGRSAAAGAFRRDRVPDDDRFSHGVRLRLGDDLPGRFLPPCGRSRCRSARAARTTDPTPDSTRTPVPPTGHRCRTCRTSSSICSAATTRRPICFLRRSFSAAQVALLKAGRLPTGRL